MTQVTPGYEQNPFSSFNARKTRGFPAVSDQCCCKATEYHFRTLDPKQHSKVQLVLLQGKKREAHLLSKLSPYFRSCVSQELLKDKMTSRKQLSSLCYSCNRTLDRRLEQTISFNRIKLKRRALPATKGDKNEDTVEQLTTTPWKNSREQQCTVTSCLTPFQRFERAQSFMEFNKQCFNCPPPLILPEIIKITPQKKKTPQHSNSKIYDVGFAPPPTPVVRYIRELSPEVRNMFAVTMASAR